MKIACTVLLLIFLFYDVSFAVPYVINPPKNTGTLSSVYEGKGKRFIIHIQDAHCNYEAQANIASLLKFLAKEHNISLVCVEGAAGIVDTGWFRSFPDREVRWKAADRFMQKGDITGAEFFSITAASPIRLYGIEDRDLYSKNFNAFASSYPAKKEIVGYLSDIRGALGKLKNYIYAEKLKNFDNKIEGYKDEKVTLSNHVQFLSTRLKEHTLDLKEYPNFAILMSTLVHEEKIDFDVVNKERARLIDSLSALLTKDELRELTAQSISFKNGEISAAEYHLYLKKISEEKGIKFSGEYRNFDSYIIYASLHEKLDNKSLFEELDEIKNAIKERLFVNEDERLLSLLWDNINILLSLVNLKLLNKEFHYYKAHKDEFTLEVFADFIAPKIIDYALAWNIDAPTDAVKDTLPKLEEFYVLGRKRDEALVGNTIKAMDTMKADAAVLITGGFHTEGMMHILEDKGISYTVVCPSITKDVESPYIKVLTNQRDPLEGLF